MLALQSDKSKRSELLRKRLSKKSGVYPYYALDSIIGVFDYNLKNKFPNHNYQDNYDLEKQYKTNRDKVLFELLIQNNIKLVQKIASLYLNYLGNTHTFEDLVSEGVVGLIKAIGKFDPSLGYEFAAYAIYWIRAEIVRSIMNTGTIVRVPVYMVELVLKIKKLEQSYKLENREVNVQTICEKLQLTPEKYKEAKSVEYQFLNLIALNSITSEVEAPETGGILRTDYHDKLQYSKEELEKFADPALIVEAVDFRTFIHKLLLSTLSERERNIIKLRFGFYDGSVKTLQEVGEIYGVTRERVRQIEIKALEKLFLKLSTLNQIDYKKDPNC
ncbi:MAG: RNA polymerase sigma factor RpoD/SigA [Desulfosporosinus sp.]|nr:RNA polymerase sigma factor RpoD/SigA [Desulfosporosinus sp.]